MAAKLYAKLPGQRLLVLGTRPSLWLAEDHLLALERSVGSERYRRFYLRDIEALIIRRTNRRAAINGALLGAALFYGVPMAMLAARNTPDFAAWQSNSHAVGVFMGTAAVYLIPAWLLLILALINTLRGPACETRIRTAVQIEPLPSLGRIGAVEKVLRRLAPLIAQAQGAVSLEQIAAADWSLAPVDQTRFIFPEPLPRDGAALPRQYESGRMHFALFASFLAISGLSFWDSAADSTAATALGLAASFAALVFMIMALRRQGRGDIPTVARRLAWAALGYFSTLIAVGTVFTFIYVFRHGGQQPGDPMFFRDEPGYAQVQFVSALIALALGAGGLLSLALRRPAAAEPPPAMPSPSAAPRAEPPAEPPLETPP